MARRLHQTLADYVVIAISPALIMLLVGSLVFFLLRVFYQGEFPERLHWVMACFVFAAVLIGRIAIEEGRERAALYGAALAMAVGVASNRFMEFQGTWIDTFSWPINFGLIGVIWWCAHKLTWDCTVIDDTEDSSGEGLLQIAGLERPPDARDAAADRRLEGTTTREVPVGFWQRYVQNQRKPHAPGVWVVYFSLAALPLFGIGQRFIPADDTAARRYVFWLLCVYVASALALLVTTSFLGLRRYLRQRRIEMPTLMANLWLGTGAAIIAALLAVAMLLPRPSAEYAVSELPFKLGSPEQNASKHAPIRRDGTKDDAEAPAAAEEQPNEQKLDEQATDDQQPQGAGNQPQGEAQGDGAAAAKSAESKSGGEGKGESAADKGKQGDTSQGQKASPAKPGEDDQSQAKSDPGQQEKSDQRSEFMQKFKEQQEKQKAEQQAEQAKQAEQAAQQPQEQQADQQDEQPAEQQPEQSAPSNPSPNMPSTQETIQPLVSPLMRLIGWLRMAIFGLIGLYLLIRYREAVFAGIRNLLNGLAEWWRNLMGKKRDYGLAADEVLDLKLPATPFSAYNDPFAAGTANSYSPEELVRYSFEAFEAWGPREHGCPRDPDQTPHELARDVSKANVAIAAEARNIAALYAQVAYARGGLPANSREQLGQLWARMRMNPAIAVPATPEDWP